MNPDNLPQPPEGVLESTQPWWPGKVGEKTWMVLKAKLTGGEAFGTGYSSAVYLTSADADTLIENLKKDPRGYPQMDDGGGGMRQMENIIKYQEWLREEYLEKPFRKQVDAKIEEAAINSRMKEIEAERKEKKPPKTKEEVVVILEDKIEALESILEDVNPPRSEYQVSDQWEGTYTTGAPSPAAKKTKKKGRPKGSKNKATKKKKTSPAGGGGGDQPPKKSFATKMGGGLKNVGKSLGKSLIDKLEGGAPLGENQGPSVLSAGIWIGKKITTAFGDAKKQQQRAAEAEENGAEIPSEMKEKGYFLKKALGYQFGGQVLDQTVGAFFENIPSKQSSKKAGFGDTFGYGDKDPEKKKQQAQQQSEIKDLASGFRNVTKSLSGVNQSINQLTQTMTSLVDQTTRVADILEAIQNSIAGSIDVEINSENDAAAADTASTGGDINIGDINLGGDDEEGGLNLLDILSGADDILDIANLRKKKTGLARQNPLYKKARKKGMPKMPRGKGMPRGMPKMPGGMGKFGMLKNIMNVGRTALSEGTGPVAGSVNALVGEAGPELITGASPTKLAEGGVTQGAGSNILATGLGAGVSNLMKLAQPFANVMEMPFKVIGAQISGALASLISAAGPFSGVLAKMFSPLLGGLATTFGLKKTAFAAELDSAAMTEKQGAKELSKFFSSFFKLFGINIGGGDEEKKDDKKDDPSGASGQWGALLDLIAGKESGGNYEALNPSTTLPGVTKMTISEVAKEAERVGLSKGGTGAVGKYQQLPRFLVGRAKAAGLNPDKDLFSPANQDLIVTKVNIEEDRGGKKWLKGEMNDADFMQGLSQEFAALPNASGNFHYPSQSSSITPEKVKEALKKVKGNPTQMARGGVESTTSSFTNQIRGVFEMDGPDTGYRVPPDLTSGQPVIGHGLEWLIKMQNKFIILPGINKEYNVYRDPAKAFTRYEQIGSRGGVQVDGLVDVMGKIIYNDPSQNTEVAATYGEGFPKTPNWMKQLEAEYQRNIGRPLNPGTGRGGRGMGDTWEGPVKGASLPEGQITPIGIPRNTGSGTIGTTVIAMVQPMIQYVPVSVPGPATVEYVPANPFTAAKIGNEMVYLQGLS